MKVIIILFLVGGCVCAGVPDSTPHYYQMQNAIENLIKNLQVHIVSMEKDEEIPELDDHRRHYAEIFHVLHDTRCVYQPHGLTYQSSLNNSVAIDGIKNPQTVIDEAKVIIEDIKNNTNEISRIVKSTCVKAKVSLSCNQIVDQEVYRNPKAMEQLSIYQVAAQFAEIIGKKNDEFVKVSKAHSSLQYVIGGADKLKEAILKLAELRWKTRDYDPIC